MFLSVMVLIHDRFPCSHNFFRFIKNYDKYKEETLTKGAKSPDSSGSKSPCSPISSIALPKYDLELSPVNKYLKNSPSGGGGGKAFNFNVDTKSQKHFLANAASKIKQGEGAADQEEEASKDDESLKEILETQSPEAKTQVINKIPITQFKQSQLTSVKGKLMKTKSYEEEEEKKKGDRSPTQIEQAIRLPNFSQVQRVEGNQSGKVQDGYASPTNLLSG